MDDIQNGQYAIPITIRSGFKPHLHILFVFFSVLFIASIFLPIDDPMFVFIKIFSFVLGMFFLVMWLYTGVLKKTAVILNRESITFKTIFGEKSVQWAEIALIQTYSQSNNTFIGIVSKRKLKKRKDNFLGFLSDIFGATYEISIPLNNFPKADPERLYATIDHMVQTHQSENIEPTEPPYSDPDSETIKERSTIAALFKSLLVSLIIGLVYGISISLLQVNFLLIPMLGFLWILYTYSKNCNEATNRLPARLILGLICSVQVLFAPLVSLLIDNRGLFGSYGIMDVVYSCIRYMAEHPDDLMRNYVFAAIFFIIGITSGASSKFMRRIKRMFLKKMNGYYIVREKRYVSIYVTDYADYDENEEKFMVGVEPNHCLIDSEGKKINSFYIPVEIFEVSGVTAYGFGRETINDIDYYRILFSETGRETNIRSYGYDCYLIANQSKQLEVVKIEVD